MDPQVLSIVATVAWEAIKDGVKVTTNRLQKALKGWILKDDACENVIKVVNSIPESYKINAKLVEGYLESNTQLIDVLSKVAVEGVGNITQYHSGSGDNVGRDKNSY